jgi:branched-chain amino acid transport system ATP-binding protein
VNDILLQVEGLSKRFGGVEAVAGVSFHVRRGEIYSLIGPNGAGKTTTFNMISSVVRPSGGTVHFEGRDITGTASHRMSAIGIGRTFQNLAVFKHATVVQNLLVGRHCHMRSNVFDAAWFFGRARREELEHRRKVEEIIDFLEIEDIRDMPVGALSYGMQKRVELGRALATEPKLLLLDEMVSGMNPRKPRTSRASCSTSATNSASRC